jgi:tRNA pseudouridine65 synthase
VITVLAQTARWVAIDKPAGLVVHRGERTRDQPAALQLVRDRVGQRVYPVHRLDRATSGVLLLALDREAARHLGGELTARRVDKRYLAWVRGWVDEHGSVDHPLVEEGGTVAAEAITQWRRLATLEVPIAVGRYASARYSLVEARPLTGRMHQIRRHFAHLRHPIVGDVRYGDGKHNRMFREHLDLHRMMLHASQLSFVDTGGELRTIAAPRPATFELAGLTAARRS